MTLCASVSAPIEGIVIVASSYGDLGDFISCVPGSRSACHGCVHWYFIICSRLKWGGKPASNGMVSSTVLGLSMYGETRLSQHSPHAATLQGGRYLSPAPLHGPFTPPPPQPAPGFQTPCPTSPSPARSLQWLPSPLLALSCCPPLVLWSGPERCDFPVMRHASLAGPPAQRPLEPTPSHPLLKSYSYLKACSLPPSWTELVLRVGQACV